MPTIYTINELVHNYNVVTVQNLTINDLNLHNIMACSNSIEITGDSMFPCRCKVGGGGFSPSCPPVPTPMIIKMSSTCVPTIDETIFCVTSLMVYSSKDHLMCPII